MENKYIYEFIPNRFEFKENDGNLDAKKHIENAIYEIYNLLEEKCDVNINEDSFKDKDDLVKKIVMNYFDDIGIDYIPFKIQDVIEKKAKEHSAIFVELENKLYLIDPTYRQFFLEKNCQEKSRRMNNSTILINYDPGFYYLQNEKAKPIALELLTNGYIEFTEEVAKVYGEAFKETMNCEVSKIKEEISGKEYINKFFLKDQVKGVVK